MRKSGAVLLCAIVFFIISAITGIEELAAQSWTSIDGGGTYGISSTSSLNSDYPSVAVYNGEMYVIWQENTSVAAYEVHVKKFNGSGWLTAGNSPGSSLLYSSSYSLMYPRILYFNGALYAAWSGFDAGIWVVHVKKFNGSTWTYTQDYIPGENRSNINNGITANAQKIDINIHNGELYAIWVEQDHSGAGIYQVRVSKFNGSLWTSIDGNGNFGINYNTSYHVTHPTLCVFNNYIYAAWMESNSSGISQIRVRRYEGGSAWTFVDGGGIDGLNYITTTQLHDAPFSLASYNGTMNAFWSESNRIRVKYYDGSSWNTNIDGGTGWNHNSTVGAYYPACYSYDKLYVTWEQNPIPRQIRVVSFNGTSKQFIDGDSLAGINNTRGNRAHFPKLTEYNGNLVAVWSEELTSVMGSANQIRAKTYPLPPFVKSVTVPSNGTYTAGQTLNFTVNFSKNVLISGGVPYIPITLNTGGAVNAMYTSGSGSSSINFRYTIVSGEEDPDGITLGTTLNNGGATLQSMDATPLDVNMTLNNIGSSTGIIVDATRPTVTSVTSNAANGFYKTGDIIPIQVNFSEVVTITGTPTLALNSGGIASYASGNGTLSLTFNYKVMNGQNSADLNYSATSSLNLSGGTISDASGNHAILTLPAVGEAGSLGSQKNIVVDGTAPSIIIFADVRNPTNESSFMLEITCSEAITGFTLSDINVVNATISNLQTHDNIYWTVFLVPKEMGDVEVEILSGTVTDSAGNSNTASAYFQRTYDPKRPSVTLSSESINPTKDNPIVVNIQFDEAIIDFEIAALYVRNGTPSNFQPLDSYSMRWSADIYPVTDGLVTVDLFEGVAHDYASNGNIAPTQFSITCDITSPTVTITSLTDPITSNSPIPVSITFSEPVTDFLVSDISVTNGIPGNFSGSGTNYTADIIPSGQGLITVTVADGVALDTIGNENKAASLTRVYDNIAPTVLSVSSPTENGIYQSGNVIPLTTTFSDTVIVKGVPTLTLNSGGTAFYNAGSGTSILTFNYTVAGSDSSADLDYVSTGSLNLSGGQIEDRAKNAAILILPEVGSISSLGGQKNIVIKKFTTGIEVPYKDDIIIYPNPAKNVIYIKGSKCFVNIYDINSHPVLKKQVDDNGALNISSLKSGMYLIKIENKIYKLIKE